MLKPDFCKIVVKTIESTPPDKEIIIFLLFRLLQIVFIVSIKIDEPGELILQI